MFCFTKKRKRLTNYCPAGPFLPSVKAKLFLCLPRLTPGGQRLRDLSCSTPCHRVPLLPLLSDRLGSQPSPQNLRPEFWDRADLSGRQISSWHSAVFTILHQTGHLYFKEFYRSKKVEKMCTALFAGRSTRQTRGQPPAFCLVWGGILQTRDQHNTPPQTERLYRELDLA